MKKVLLLFPPEWVPTAPYLALPSLTAVLRENGIDVVQKDINVEMYDHIFTRGFLLFVKSRIDQRLRDYREKQGMGRITKEERDIKGMLKEYSYVDLEHHINEVEKAKEIMRGPEFYDVSKAEWSLNAFREVMGYVSAAYHPEDINFYPVESNLNIYSQWVSGDFLKAPHDDSVNEYAYICRQLVFPIIEDEKPDLVGISIGTPVQLMSGVTFSTLIKEKYPENHVTVGGNIITRLREEFQKKEQFFGTAFDSIIFYEGEHPIVWLTEALDGKRKMEDVPKIITLE